MNSYGNRGMPFESLIEFANKRYRLDGKAIIEKQHTLCKPIRNAMGRVVSAKYDEKATVDFMGRVGATPIAFEAKHCSDDKISLNRVQEHQCRFLADWTKCAGTIGFILVSFRMEHFYIIPWQYWAAALLAKEKKRARIECFSPIQTKWRATGKASIKKDELPPEWEVDIKGHAGLDYLAVIKRLWRA